MSNIKPFFCTTHYSKNCLLENEIETVRYLGTGAEMSRYFGTSLMVPRCQDTSNPRHFGTIRLVPKCPDSSAPVPKCLADTSALVLNCLDLQQTFLLQQSYRRKFYSLLLLTRTTDFIVMHKNTPPTTIHYTHVQ